MQNARDTRAWLMHVLELRQRNAAIAQLFVLHNPFEGGCAEGLRWFPRNGLATNLPCCRFRLPGTPRTTALHNTQEAQKHGYWTNEISGNNN